MKPQVETSIYLFLNQDQWTATMNLFIQTNFLSISCIRNHTAVMSPLLVFTPQYWMAIQHFWRCRDPLHQTRVAGHIFSFWIHAFLSLCFERRGCDDQWTVFWQTSEHTPNCLLRCSFALCRMPGQPSTVLRWHFPFRSSSADPAALSESHWIQMGLHRTDCKKIQYDNQGGVEKHVCAIYLNDFSSGTMRNLAYL